METRKLKKRPTGSKEPKAIGVILDEILRSDSHLAAAFRKYKKAFEAETEGETDQLYPDTLLCTDVKVYMSKPGRMPVDTFFEGYFARYDEDEFLIIEKASEKKVKTVQRNPVIFAGACVNVHLLADGSKRLDFNHPRFTSEFTFRNFCIAAAQELLTIASEE